MRNKNRQLKRTCALCLVFLLLAALLSSCGLTPTPANSRKESTTDTTTEPTSKPEAPEPEPDPEALAREQRLSEAKDGFLWDDGFLRAIDEEGNLRTACYIGVLKFSSDGKYTSGNRELDELVAKVVRENTESVMTRMEMLRAMYDYVVNNIRYVGLANYNLSYLPAHGKDGWMPELAIKTLNNGYGNCYSFAAAFAALARGVGYQAYAVGGEVGATEDPHGWVQILDENGNTWMNDPEIEYRFGDYYKTVQSKKTAPDLFYKSPDKIGVETGMSYHALRDPYAAEAKEAEARRFGMIPVPVDPTETDNPDAANNIGQSAKTADGAGSSVSSTTDTEELKTSGEDKKENSNPEKDDRTAENKNSNESTTPE